MSIASSIQNIKISADLAAFDAVSTTVAGIQAGQTADEILGTFLQNQAIGFGIGYAIGKTIQLGSSLYQRGFVIAPAQRVATGGEKGDITDLFEDARAQQQ